MATDNNETDSTGSITDRIRDRAADARRKRQREKAERQLERKRRRERAARRTEAVRETADEVKGAVGATRTGGALSTLAEGAKSIGSTVVDAAAPPDEDESNGGGNGGGSFFDGVASSSDDTEFFDGGDAAFRDVDGDDEREALFGDFGASADLSVFDTDGDGDGDVVFADQPDAELSIDTARMDVGRVVTDSEQQPSGGDAPTRAEQLGVLFGGMDQDPDEDDGDTGRPRLF